MLLSILLATALVTSMAQCTKAGTKPIFDYTFGANCPFSKQFGRTLTQLYLAPGLNTTVDFKVGAAIRACGGKYECPEEDPGCNGTKWVLCAFDEARRSNKSGNPASQKIGFLGCCDDKEGKNWEDKARTCASAGSLDFERISACASGSAGEALKKTAAHAWEKKFMHRRCGGERVFGVIKISSRFLDVEHSGFSPGISTSSSAVSRQAHPPPYKDILRSLCQAPGGGQAPTPLKGVESVKAAAACQAEVFV